MNSKLSRSLPAAGLLALLSACAAVSAPDAAPAPTSFFKLTGAQQCETPTLSAARLQAEVDDLKAAGIGVADAQCGHDGSLYPAVCGGGTGDVWVLTVAPESAPGMLSRGYRTLDRALPIETRPCR